MMHLTVYGLEIPGETETLDGFRDWVASLGEDAPRVHFSRGRIHIEMPPQNLASHEPLGRAINWVLIKLTADLDLGRYFAPPSWFTEQAVGLSTEPDGYLVRWATLESGQVRINPDRPIEMLGRPDMALEVVSKTSQQKDLKDLARDYARAGVSEYWIADGRAGDPTLRILLLQESGTYQDQAPDNDRWLFSPMWRRRFRLRRFTDRAGLVDFELEHPE